MNYNFIYDNLMKFYPIVTIAFFNTLGLCYYSYYTYTKLKEKNASQLELEKELEQKIKHKEIVKDTIDNENVKLELKYLLDKLTNIENDIIVLSDKLEKISEKKRN